MEGKHVVSVAIQRTGQNAQLNYSEDGVSSLLTHGVDWLMELSLYLRTGSQYTVGSVSTGQCLKTLSSLVALTA